MATGHFQEGDADRITVSCRTHARSGVETEALTAASVAAPTPYDMLQGRGEATLIASLRPGPKEGRVSGPWSA